MKRNNPPYFPEQRAPSVRKTSIILFAMSVALLTSSDIRSDMAVPQYPYFERLIQDGQRVRVIFNRNNYEGSISINRNSPQRSKLLVDNSEFESLSLSAEQPDAGAFGDLREYEFVDECVPPGKAEYTLFHHDGPWCSNDDTKTIVVVDLGQDCPITKSEFDCDSEPSESGCSVIHSNSNSAFAVLLMLLGMIAILLNRTGSTRG